VSLATLDMFKKEIKLSQKLRIKVGKMFKICKQDPKKHPYWGPFFKRAKKGITFKELLEYPDMNGTDWRWIEEGKVLQHFEFGLIETRDKNNKLKFEVPEFFTATLIK